MTGAPQAKSHGVYSTPQYEVFPWPHLSLRFVLVTLLLIILPHFELWSSKDVLKVPVGNDEFTMDLIRRPVLVLYTFDRFKKRL